MKYAERTTTFSTYSFLNCYIQSYSKIKKLLLKWRHYGKKNEKSKKQDTIFFIFTLTSQLRIYYILNLLKKLNLYTINKKNTAPIVYGL